MKTYNKIMEIFWISLGVCTLGFALYGLITGKYLEDLKYLFTAGSMAVILGVFRLIYRRHNPQDHSNRKENN